MNVQCRQCGDPVPPDREGWATPVCHKCLPPIGTKRAMAEAVNSLAPLALAVDYLVLFGTPERNP